MCIMGFCRIATVAGVLLAPAVLAADKPLAEAAKTLSSKMPAGGIVTGESIAGKTSYAVAGKVTDAKDVTPQNIVFEIGSISKVFTGLLLAQAVVEKQVTLDTTVASLLNQETFADTRIGAITLEQLSTHTSVLPRIPVNMAAGSSDPYANYDEAMLIAFLKEARLEGKGPFKASYSNLGAGLLGLLLGKVWRMSWEEAVVTKICQPLGLMDTAVHPAGAHLVAAMPFDGRAGAEPWHFDALSGAGALRSTVADMVRFGQAIAHPEQTALKEAFALALQPRAPFGSADGRIGLGIIISQLDGQQVYEHDGGTGGFRSSLQVIPARDHVRVALVNNADLAGSAVIAATRVTGRKGKPAEMKLEAAALAEFPGVYELDSNTRFTVLLQDGQLWVRLTGQPFLRVFSSAPDRFFYRVVPAELQFHREKGKISALTLFQNGREMKALRTDEAAPAITLRTDQELRPYAGTYTVMGVKDMNVTVIGNTLHAQLAGQPALPVFEVGPDRFEYDAVKATLVFTRDEQKNINGLTLLQNGMTMPAVRKQK